MMDCGFREWELEGLTACGHPGNTATIQTAQERCNRNYSLGAGDCGRQPSGTMFQGTKVQHTADA